MYVNRCAGALLVTPYNLRRINNWPTVGGSPRCDIYFARPEMSPASGVA